MIEGAKVAAAFNAAKLVIPGKGAYVGPEQREKFLDELLGGAESSAGKWLRVLVTQAMLAGENVNMTLPQLKLLVEEADRKAR
jgi:hypothetical protein